MLGTACSDDTASTAREGPTTTVSVAERPASPAADVTQEITGDSRPFLGEPAPVETPGYVEHEYVAAGEATDYTAPDGMPASGEWRLEPGTTAPYRTRIVVRRPADMTTSSGTVVVEWLNVSGGLDADPEWSSLAEEIIRQGHVWVGVSAQLIGVAGGPVLVSAPGAEGVVGKGLKALDPARYGSLEHPGDGYSFDIYTQVARALREGGPVLDGVKPKALLAAGESQSAIALTTYYDGVQPLTHAFDGFFVHSRAFAALPLVGPGEYADLAGSMTSSPDPVLLRTDLDAPVLELQSEGDVVGVLNSVAARQPDTDRFRLWEVAGTSHADQHLIGAAIADALDCGAPINNGPMHVVAKTALRGLDTWVRTGTTPATAPRIEVTAGDRPEVRRDANGIALGGIRTPVVDVPVDVVSGAAAPKPDLICLLMGSTEPLPAALIASMYESREAYEQRFAASADAAVSAGFVLKEDRDALLAYAEPSRIV
jgi:hypothetical protein